MHFCLKDNSNKHIAIHSHKVDFYVSLALRSNTPVCSPSMPPSGNLSSLFWFTSPSGWGLMLLTSSSIKSSGLLACKLKQVVFYLCIEKLQEAEVNMLNVIARGFIRLRLWVQGLSHCTKSPFVLQPVIPKNTAWCCDNNPVYFIYQKRFSFYFHQCVVVAQPTDYNLGDTLCTNSHKTKLFQWWKLVCDSKIALNLQKSTHCNINCQTSVFFWVCSVYLV